MPLNTINRLLHNPLLWTWCACVLALLLLGQRLTTRTLRLRELLASEEGASYSLNLALVTPLYTFMICFLVELTLLLNVQMGLDYAAYSAARSAIVWLPAENTPRNTPQQFRYMVHLAAAQAMTPYASSLKDHVRSDGTDDSAGEAAYLSAYRDLVTTGDRQTARYVVAKRRYAMAATSVEFDPSPTAVLNPSSSPDKLLTVRVRYEMPFNIPGIGRILGRRSTSGPGYVRDLVSTVTLEVERPRSKTGRLDWDYDSRPASHQSSSGQAGTGQGGTGPSGAGPSGAGRSGTGPSGTGQSGTGQSGTGQSGTGQSGTGQSGTGQSGTGQSGTGQSGTGQSGTGQSGTGQSGTGQSGTGQSGTGQSGTGQSGTGQSGTGQSGTGQSGTGQSGTGQSGAGPCIGCGETDDDCSKQKNSKGSWDEATLKWVKNVSYSKLVDGVEIKFVVPVYMADWKWSTPNNSHGPAGYYEGNEQTNEGRIILSTNIPKEFATSAEKRGDYLAAILSHETIHAHQDGRDGKLNDTYHGTDGEILNVAAREAEAYRDERVPAGKRPRTAVADALEEAAALIKSGNYEAARRVAEKNPQAASDIYRTLCLLANGKDYYDARDYGHAKRSREMSPDEYWKALLNAGTYQEVVALTMQRHGEQSPREQVKRAQGDVIRLRRWYFDQKVKPYRAAGQTLSNLTRDELTGLHRYPLVNADQFFEGYRRAWDNGAVFAAEMIYVYNRKKLADWNRGDLVSATDNDGRSYSPPKRGQYLAGMAGVEAAVKHGRTAAHGLSISQQINQYITMLDIALGNNR